ncbi:MAG TPA: hypothetical protein VGU44_03285, partial [Gammaproteobacteria bacterium]|nr:hypothetical protein [Gammaproteobacteria bacterium]
MNDKERNDDKVSTRSLRGIAEISVNIALVLCTIYVVYSFFYKDSFIENMISDALTATEAARVSSPKDSLN